MLDKGIDNGVNGKRKRDPAHETRTGKAYGFTGIICQSHQKKWEKKSGTKCLEESKIMDSADRPGNKLGNELAQDKRGKAGRVKALLASGDGPLLSISSGGNDEVSRLAREIRDKPLQGRVNCIEEATAFYELTESAKENLSRLSREIAEGNGGVIDAAAVQRAKEAGRVPHWMTAIFERALASRTEPAVELRDIAALVVMSERSLIYRQRILRLPRPCVELLRTDQLSQNEGIALTRVEGVGHSLERKHIDFAEFMARRRAQGMPLTKEERDTKVQEYGTRLPKRPEQREAALLARSGLTPEQAQQDPATVVRLALRTMEKPLGTGKAHLEQAVRFAKEMPEAQRQSLPARPPVAGAQGVPGLAERGIGFG